MHGFVLKFYPVCDFYNASPLEVFTCVLELNGFDEILVLIYEESVCFALFLSENLAASTLKKLSTGP